VWNCSGACFAGDYELLRDVVREHVVLASQLIADVKSTGSARLLDRNRRSG
jgi:hypothetical protein